jgi:GNAT superfamily N-acetyltransferase
VPRPNGAEFRGANAADAPALRDLERSAGLAALGHVFPPDRHPYPSDDVLARWHLVLADQGVMVELAVDDRGPVCLLAYDEYGTLRHLAVAPRAWGQGLATAAVTRAVRAWRTAGHRDARLWCLAENHRARGLYERLGWRLTGLSQPAPWPPYPTEMEYALDLDQS